ncbi:riboflavin synthase [Tumidithrix elongata RA019]|uniref:Riboflavin synthase n=1 Tax=Tumidithrix elongata BACA0141 TaxID=2716417 RepID=A0AAW9PV08_9CYAN|nr:riboflavin synthase [Tumidithrix elongata RA019]
MMKHSVRSSYFMFTGLVQALGEVEQCDRYQIAIRCPEIRNRLAIGDSVAVNGVCLTVAKISSSGFIADVSPETLSRTNLQDRSSKYVNLETALAVGDKLGGHFVSGHIDGLGTLRDRQLQGGSWAIAFDAPLEVAKYIVFKGSIAVNGISLTVSQCSDSGDRFSVAVIPHTYESTNLKYLSLGDKINLEADMIGKYVEKFLRYPETASNKQESMLQAITPEFLTEHGW